MNIALVSLNRLNGAQIKSLWFSDSTGPVTLIELINPKGYFRVFHSTAIGIAEPIITTEIASDKLIAHRKRPYLVVKLSEENDLNVRRWRKSMTKVMVVQTPSYLLYDSIVIFSRPFICSGLLESTSAKGAQPKGGPCKQPPP